MKSFLPALCCSSFSSPGWSKNTNPEHGFVCRLWASVLLFFSSGRCRHLVAVAKASKKCCVTCLSRWEMSRVRWTWDAHGGVRGSCSMLHLYATLESLLTWDF